MLVPTPGLRGLAAGDEEPAATIRNVATAAAIAHSRRAERVGRASPARALAGRGLQVASGSRLIT